MTRLSELFINRARSFGGCLRRDNHDFPYHTRLSVRTNVLAACEYG